MKARRTVLAGIAWALISGALAPVTLGQSGDSLNTQEARAAVLQRMREIEVAARSLDPDKVFSYVLENDAGALLQNGTFFLTRDEALESTRLGFRGLREVDYRFDQQHVTFLSPSAALVTGDGSTTATTDDGQVLTTRFVQSVVLLLADGEWMVLHAHRSFPPAR